MIGAWTADVGLEGVALLEAMLLDSKGWVLGKWAGTGGAAEEEVEEGIGAGDFV